MTPCMSTAVAYSDSIFAPCTDLRSIRLGGSASPNRIYQPQRRRISAKWNGGYMHLLPGASRSTRWQSAPALVSKPITPRRR